MKTLVVTSPFGGREIGHAITDPLEIEEILGGEHAHQVVMADHPSPIADIYGPAEKAKQAKVTQPDETKGA